MFISRIFEWGESNADGTSNGEGDTSNPSYRNYQALGLKLTVLSWDLFEEGMLYIDGVSNRILICTGYSGNQTFL